MFFEKVFFTKDMQTDHTAGAQQGKSTTEQDMYHLYVQTPTQKRQQHQPSATKPNPKRSYDGSVQDQILDILDQIINYAKQNFQIDINERALQLEFEEAHQIFMVQTGTAASKEAKVLAKLTLAFENKAGIPSNIVLQQHNLIKQLAESVTQMIKSIDTSKKK